ncbi:MAG: oxygen-independent coproporphyrinogen III oxidase [Planctomycetota bacterium]|nr:MAG: oxygen-independent coproporphyrinogen III oxidase [Planctomycetota bacterium]
MTSPIFASPRAAYLHVPFCAHRCGYCDFTLLAGRDDLSGDYLRALEIELRQLERPREVDTLFFGGGTPTHLEPDKLARLLELAREWFTLAPGYEFSVEANPAGLTDEKLRLMADAGVNRVSLGVQSFDEGLLKLLERDHRAADILDAVARLQQRFENVSLDLIFALPGQTLAHWRETLRRAIELQPTHLSTYGLTFEKGTTFWSRREKGAIEQLPNELERDMYAAAMDDLTAAGFEQYEISNFARPGFRCRHNQTYWRALPYFGFGPGAARYLRGRRESNHRSTTTWIKRVFAGQSGVAMSEELTPEHRAREAIVLGLRQLDGIRRDEFQTLTDFDLDALTGETIRDEVAAGRIEDFGDGIRITRAGRFFADPVMIAFL